MERCQEFYKTDIRDQALKVKEDFAGKIKFIKKLPVKERTLQDYMLNVELQ